MSTHTAPLLRIFTVAVLCTWFVSCDGGGGKTAAPPPDVGNNDINTVVCIGDSITQGECVPAGAPYPARLAGLNGKNCINSGVCGERTAATLGRAPGVLQSSRPGFMCLLIGANDAIFSYDPGTVGENIRAIIQAAKAQKTVPLVATLLPMYAGHAVYDGDADAISVVIRQVVMEEGATLVDLRMEFGTDQTLLQADGLHPSDSGTQLIAMAFNDKIPKTK